MGAGASITAAKEDLEKATDEELKLAIALLSPEVKAKLEAALTNEKAVAQKKPDLMAKLVTNRELWEANRAKFDAWLDLTREEALEPDLEIVDPHHHVWDMRELKVCSRAILRWHSPLTH